MRVCPKCGYVDPPEWRPHKHRFDVDYTHIGEFQGLSPKLA